MASPEGRATPGSRPGRSQRSAGSGQRGRLPAPERRQRLVEAFVAEALRSGSISAVGLRAVLRRAGCTAPVLYRLFGDRDALVRAAVRSTHASMLARLEALARDRRRSAEERLRLLAEDSLAKPGGEGEAFEALVAAECRRDPRLARGVREVFARFEALLVAILADGVARRELAPDLDCEYAAWRIIDLGLFRDHAWLMRLARPARLDYLPRALESLLEEIRA